jgi:hypothetical protein
LVVVSAGLYSNEYNEAFFGGRQVLLNGRYLKIYHLESLLGSWGLLKFRGWWLCLKEVEL